MRVFYTNRIKALALMLLIYILTANYASADVTFAEGDGTEGNPYQITTSEQLQAISNLTKHYKLMDDITLTEDWTPIGVSGSTVSVFTGSLDGAGYLISGLTVADGTNAALFASNAGTIKNLGVSVAEAGITGQYAGGIAGKNTNAGTITNCYTTGAFVSTKNDWSSVGGIVGQNEGKIYSCYTTLKEIRKVGTSSYNYYVGGIAGENTSTGSIQHCLVLCEKIDMSNGSGIVYMDRIAGSQADLSDSADNNTNFYGYNIEFIKFPNNSPSQPYGMPGLLWSGSFAEENTSWAFDEAKKNFYLKTTDGVQMETSLSVATYRYLQGEGTATVPYEISTTDDFKRMSFRTNQNYSQETDKHYKLTQAVTISEDFLQISATRPFKGMFDGNGQTITMTKLPSYPNAQRRYGLFGQIGGNCEIKNLHIDCTVDIDKTNETSDNNLSIGTLCTTDDSKGKSIIENCYVTGTLTVTYGKAFGIGGLVGTCSGGVIKNCFTDVDIKVTITAPAKNSTFYAGGIARNIMNTGSIQNCYAKGSIEMSANNYLRAGGISGNYDGPAPKNCLALNPSIAMTSTDDIANMSNSRIATKGYWQKYETTNNNYASLKMTLSKNGTAYVPISDTEEAGTDQAYQKYMEEDGIGWYGELPSAEQWELTADGYVNLKSIRETFGLQQQIKLTDYVPFSITVPTTTHGTITSTPEKGAFAGEKVTLTITPDTNYLLKPGSFKVTGQDGTTITVDEEDNSFVMPTQAVTVTAEFELDKLDLTSVTDADSLLISQKDADWFYQIKNKVTTKSLPTDTDTDIPFNGTLSGTLASDKTLSFEPTCKGELTFDNVTAPTLVIRSGASVVLSDASKLTYTEVKNDGGALVAREGAIITNTATGQVKINKLTITTPKNGTLAVRVGDVAIASGDMLAVDTKFSVTATPASGYQRESLAVMNGSTSLTATAGLYAMPDAEVTVSATFKSTYVPPVPDPVYYKITLPEVEGAVTDPKAGEHRVEEVSNFSFTLTLKAGYKQSVPVVTANGTVLTPRAGDGRYQIGSISVDTQIKIDGVVRDIPTGNAEIDNDAIRIRSTVGALLISTLRPATLEVYTTSGNRLRQLAISGGDSRIPLPAGLYIIRLGDHRQKVFIR